MAFFCSLLGILLYISSVNIPDIASTPIFKALLILTSAWGYLRTIQTSGLEA